MAPELKPTNPKDALGIKKAPLSCVPLPVLMELGIGMLEGACKYGRHNYRSIGVRASVYFDAVCRHLFAWWEGEDLDPDSGMPHVVKAMACLAVLRDAQIQGQYTDDRPPVSPEGWMQELNAKAAAILERYPDHVAPYTALDDERLPRGCVMGAPMTLEQAGDAYSRTVAYLKTLPEDQLAPDEDL